MSLRKGLARAGKSSAVRKGLAGVGRLLTLDNPEGWLSGEELVGLSRDRAMKISTVNRCVELLSTSMAVLPVYIIEERTKNRMPDHHLGRVLWERPNEAMTPFDFRRLLMCNQLLRGNAYAWIYRDAVSGLPMELIPLPPDYVSMHLDLSGKVWYLFTHPVTGEVTRIRCEDMLHYKAYSEDGLEGISVLRRASLTLDTARAAQLYENSIWRNGGQPSGILTTETDLGGEYEVELEDRSGTEYEYRIDAYTGAVLTSYVEPDGHDDVDDHDDHDDDHDDDDDDDDDAQHTGSVQPTGQIGHAAAKAAALTHAGVSESRAYDMDVELDDEDGRWVYEVEFKADDMEYEYVIDAYTSAVLEYDMEQDD